MERKKLTYLLIGLVVSGKFDNLGQGALGQAVDLVDGISNSAHYKYTGGSDPTRTTSQPISQAFDGILTEDLETSCSKTTLPAVYSSGSYDYNYDLYFRIYWPDIVMIRSVFIASTSNIDEILTVRAGIDFPNREPACSKISNSNYVCNS